MGNEPSTEKPPVVHEEIIKVINNNIRQTAHLEKTAKATTILAYVGLAVIVIGVMYFVLRAVLRHERLRTNERIRNAASLVNVLSEK